MFKRAFLKLLFKVKGLASSADGELICALERGLFDILDEQERFQIAERLAMAVYPKYKFSEFGRLFLEDEKFLRYYESVMDPGNWHSLDRKYVLKELLKQAVCVEGDTAEAGVYKGASSFLICEAISGSERCNHLFDSFEGLSRPDANDGTYWKEGSLPATADDVHRTLNAFDNYKVYKGWIPDRFQEVEKRTFCFVHIDVDLYEPTKRSLEFFYPRLGSGAILLLDDVGFKTCPGATRAADEFFATRPEPVVYLPTGQGFVVKSYSG